MPLPILPINNNNEENNNSGLLDYSFLFNNNLTKTSGFRVVSNKDADLLMKIWLKGDKKNNFQFGIDENICSKTDVSRLKVNGLVEASAGGGVVFTEKAKKVITTMTLGEQNRFLNSKKEKNYTEILASMDKRGKKGYRVAMSGMIDVSKL